MEKLVISVIGLKGGTGKSTTARMLATAYAEAGLSVKIADFDVWQQTSTLWAGRRLEKGHRPDVPVECFNSIKKVLREPYAIMICDVAGNPEVGVLKIAQASDIILIPTDVSVDDLASQLSFIRQLVNAGIDRSKIMMVVNNLNENATASEAAREAISAQALAHTKSELVGRPAYQNAQNQGLAVYQTQFASLNGRALKVAREIIEFVKSKTEDKAA